MEKYIHIRNSTELNLTWKKESFQGIDFYQPSVQYSDKIDDTCIESDRDSLISLSWYGYGPGSASSMAFDSLTLDSGERLYFRVTDFNRPQLLGLVKDISNWNIDHYFLQRLFGSNGIAFNSHIFEVPAESITIYCQSTWDFVVDIILKAFDSANCWNSLFKKYPKVWDKSYEIPDSKLFMPEQTEKEIKSRIMEEFTSTNEKPYSYTTAVVSCLKGMEFKSENFDKYLQEITPLFRFNPIPQKTKWETPENKWRIVERYLNEVIS